jgi:hypothetical protein
MERGKVGWLIFISVLVVLWWLCIWELLEGGLETITKGNKTMRREICALTALGIALLVYFYPELIHKL